MHRLHPYVESAIFHPCFNLISPNWSDKVVVVSSPRSTSFDPVPFMISTCAIPDASRVEMKTAKCYYQRVTPVTNHEEVIKVKVVKNHANLVVVKKVFEVTAVTNHDEVIKVKILKNHANLMIERKVFKVTRLPNHMKITVVTGVTKVFKVSTVTNHESVGEVKIVTNITIVSKVFKLTTVTNHEEVIKVNIVTNLRNPIIVTKVFEVTRVSNPSKVINITNHTDVTNVFKVTEVTNLEEVINAKNLDATFTFSMAFNRLLKQFLITQ
ncbi:hypothetical protein WA026_002060 [Henosepilachna vigintioctopunctata]|uniref:Uncharacterized protein n=1 Tax=Henosepilachna vigintioctopunctata TaxID=420089 RepID=A0AAW1TYD7_9CUCU